MNVACRLMPNYTKSLNLPVLCAFVLTLLAHNTVAQEEQVTLQFVTFPKWTEREPIEMSIGEGKVLELIVPSNSFSKPYQVPNLPQWVFGRQILDKEEKPSFEIFGQGKSLGSKNQLILLLRLGNKPSDGLKVIALDNRLSEFGGGEFFFFNASNFDVGGMMGKTQFALKPSHHKFVKLASDDIHSREGIQFVHTVLFYRDSDETNPFFSSTWPANPKARSMIFFYHSGVNKRLRMHTIQDFLP